ncbi:MAG: hypothetical protein H7222_07270 [Methylotenera sp.]|nr:hypothetical protein [Oligoflexia bacterium]
MKSILFSLVLFTSVLSAALFSQTVRADESDPAPDMNQVLDEAQASAPAPTVEIGTPDMNSGFVPSARNPNGKFDNLSLIQSETVTAPNLDQDSLPSSQAAPAAYESNAE